MAGLIVRGAMRIAKMFKLKYEPLPHQKRAVEFMIKNPNSIIASETGSGKTFMCFLEALMFLHQGKVDKVLQIVTKKSKQSFGSDITKLTTIDVDKQVQVIYCLEDLFDFHENQNKIIGVVQYETFKQIPTVNWQDLFKKYRVLVQMDEFHKAKTAMSELYIEKVTGAVAEKPTKNYSKLNAHLYSLRMDIAYLTGFTATPLSKNLDDMFWLCTLVQPGIFNDSLLEFYNTYIKYYAYLVPIKKGSHFKRTAINRYGYKNTDKLVKILNTVTFNYFPPKDIDFIVEDYNPKECLENYKKAVSGVLDLYNERKINENGDKEDKTFSARMVDAQYVLNNSQSKKDALLRTLAKTINNGVLIYGSYYNTVDALRYLLSSLNISYDEISGATSDKKCKEVMDWFNFNPEGKVVILTAAGSQSINLQSTNNFIFYDLPWTPGEYIQAIGRIIRIGSKYTKFNIHIILAKDTLDEYKYEYLGSNEETLRYIQGNPNMFSSEIKNPNSEILKKLRKSMLWDKAN